MCDNCKHEKQNKENEIIQALRKQIKDLEFIVMNAVHDAVKTYDEDYLLIEGTTIENWLLKAVQYFEDNVEKPKLEDHISSLMVLTSNKGYYVGRLMASPSVHDQWIIEPKPETKLDFHKEYRDALDELLAWKVLGFRTENRDEFLARVSASQFKADYGKIEQRVIASSIEP